MPKIARDTIKTTHGSAYPAPFDAMFDGRANQRVGDAGGLTQFGVNITTLAPGAMSSLRHWHMNQDEFVMVINGELTLIDDHGETPLVAGDTAAFPAGDENGHHIVNKSSEDGAFLVVGTRTPTEKAFYSDINMQVVATNGELEFQHKNGEPYRHDTEQK